MQLFATPTEATTLYDVWGTGSASEPDKKDKGKKHRDRSSPQTETPEAASRQARVKEELVQQQVDAAWVGALASGAPLV